MVKPYHWAGFTAAEAVTDWLSAFVGIFSSAGPVALGESPSFGIWSGETTFASSSGCQSATFLRIPRPVNGRLLDNFGLRFVLSGRMKVGEGPAEKVATAGDGLFLDLSQPLRLEYADEDKATVELTFWVPRRLVPSELTVPGVLHGLVFGSDGPATSVLNA